VPLLQSGGLKQLNKEMKRTRFLLIFLAVLVLLGETCSALSVEVKVSTGKPVYNIDEDVYVYGSVRADGAPVANATVALEVRDPTSSPAIVRTLSTNSSGGYDLSFKLPSEAPAGTYTVNVTCNYGGGRATNVTSFGLEKYFPLVVAVDMGRSAYKPGETVGIYGSVTRGGAPVAGALVAIEVEDPKSSPVVIRVVGTDSNGSYALTFQLPSSAPLGTYVVNASASFGDQVGADDTSFQFRQEIGADINGDGKVNILDITLVAQAWGSYPGHPRWNPKCDLDGNGVVNIIDITMVAREYKP
jgi:5-hydroxyisourate hydrolase-like protein (transthyretin family)